MNNYGDFDFSLLQFSSSPHHPHNTFPLLHIKSPNTLFQRRHHPSVIITMAPRKSTTARATKSPTPAAKQTTGVRKSARIAALLAKKRAASASPAAKTTHHEPADEEIQDEPTNHRKEDAVNEAPITPMTQAEPVIHHQDEEVATTTEQMTQAEPVIQQQHDATSTTPMQVNPIIHHQVDAAAEASTTSTTQAETVNHHDDDAAAALTTPITQAETINYREDDAEAAPIAPATETNGTNHGQDDEAAATPTAPVMQDEPADSIMEDEEFSMVNTASLSSVRELAAAARTGPLPRAVSPLSAALNVSLDRRMSRKRPAELPAAVEESRKKARTVPPPALPIPEDYVHLRAPDGRWTQEHTDHLFTLYAHTSPRTRSLMYAPSVTPIPPKAFFTKAPPKFVPEVVPPRLRPSVCARLRSLATSIFVSPFSSSALAPAPAPASPALSAVSTTSTDTSTTTTSSYHSAEEGSATSEQVPIYLGATDLSPILRSLPARSKAMFGNIITIPDSDRAMVLGEAELMTVNECMDDIRVANPDWNSRCRTLGLVEEFEGSTRRIVLNPDGLGMQDFQETGNLFSTRYVTARLACGLMGRKIQNLRDR